MTLLNLINRVLGSQEATSLSRPSTRLSERLDARNEQAPITWEMIEAHPSHAVRLNVMNITGIHYPGYIPSDYDRKNEDEIIAYKIRDYVSPHDLLSLRPAEPESYAAFIMKHLSKGGKISTVSVYPMDDRVLVADHSMTIPRACGAASLDVLVPEDLKVGRIGGSEHGSNYNMIDGSVSGYGINSIGLYADVAHAMVALGWKPAWEDFDPGAQGDLEKIFGYKPASKSAATTPSELASTIAAKRPFALTAGEQPGDH